MVCTGNVCRSPLAERAARARLDTGPRDVADVVRIESAGTRALVGSAMHPASERALFGFGGDPSGFRARRLVPDLAAGADLILTMTREHRREVLAQAPRALSRTFTLREAADLIAACPVPDPDGDGGPGDRMRAVVRELAGARAHRRGGSQDDVPDPIGQPDEVHAAVGRMVVDALEPVLDRLAAAAGTAGRAARLGR